MAMVNLWSRLAKVIGEAKSPLASLSSSDKVLLDDDLMKRYR